MDGRYDQRRGKAGGSMTILDVFAQAILVEPVCCLLQRVREEKGKDTETREGKVGKTHRRMSILLDFF